MKFFSRTDTVEGITKVLTVEVAEKTGGKGIPVSNGT